MNVKVGDHIRIRKGCYDYFLTGDTGTVTKIDADGAVWASIDAPDPGPWCAAAPDDGPIEDDIEVIR